MISVEDARARALGAVSAVPEETVALEAACGRVLSRDVAARRTHPAQDVSAMDGYAVRRADVATLPTTLTVAGEIAAGQMPSQRLEPGQAVRIFTGAPVPTGADSIVLQEDVTACDDGTIAVNDVEPGRHIRAKGLDFETGTRCATRGTRLSPAHIGLLAAANVPSLYVHRRPRVALLSTGSELVLPGQTPGPGQIISSNGLMLAALLRQAGADVIDLGPVEDDEEAIRRKAPALAEADIAVTIGGASVGDHDLIQPALAPKGLEVDFWKIAMRPGKPLIFGHLVGTPFVGLPGNPVSAYVCALLFLVPMVRKSMGLAVDPNLPIMAKLPVATDLPKNGPRMTFMRAVIEGSETRNVRPKAQQDSSVLSAVAASDCLILRPPHAPSAPAGTPVSLLSVFPS